MRWIVLSAVVAACVLAVAGCGGSSSDASGSDEATAVESVAESTSTDEMEHMDTTDAEDTSTTEDTTGVDLSGSNLSDECKDLVQASAKYSQAFSSVASGGDLDLQEASEALQGVADAAPSEIKDAYQTLAAAIAKYAVALKGVDLSSGKTPDPATIAKITQAAQSFNTGEVTKATQEISAWTTENCGANAP